MTHQKRKQFWIDSPLQLQMLGYVLFLVTASLLLVSFSVLRGLSAASEESRQIFHSLDWVRENMFGPLLLSSCLSILASAVIALVWSHRFAGPLRVLSAAFGRLRHGNLSVPVRVRATDTHQELVKEFAQTQERLKDLLAADRRRLEELAARLERGGCTPKDLEAAARELRGVLSEFQL